MATSNGWKPELSGHNIKFMKDADYDTMLKYTSPKAREAFERPAYGSLAWWRSADQEEHSDEQVF